jgi:hypothetical protein
LKRIAWCSGGAQSYFESAIAYGIDAFITGEISEPKRTLPKKRAWLFWHAGTMPPSAMAHPQWRRTWQHRWAWCYEFIDIHNPA